MTPRVSVVIPARNAADTIAETLESLRAQRFADWEAIVVENDSSDGTAEVAQAAFAGDERFRLIRREAAGVNAARTAGIAVARSDLLLLLDADDLLLPEHLETMVAAIERHPDAALAFCAYIRMAEDGTLFDQQLWTDPGDMFAALSHTCPFAVHCAVVRIPEIARVGGLDPTLATGEDWDLWQRIARTGAPFVLVPRVLAVYRARPGSASNMGSRFLDSGLTVIERAHRADPRVPDPAPAHRDGQPESELGAKRVYFTTWCAGLEVTTGGDAVPMLTTLAAGPSDRVDPGGVADTLMRACCLPRGATFAAWPEIWPQVRAGIASYVRALEEAIDQVGLAKHVTTQLGRIAEAGGRGAEPHRVIIDVDAPLEPIDPPAIAERVAAVIVHREEVIGELELPAFGEPIPAAILADAIADDFGWQILGLWLWEAVIPRLELDEGPDGWTLRRSGREVARGPAVHGPALREAVRDEAAWTLFMQELWGRPDWTSAHFYAPETRDRGAGRRRAHEGWVTIRAGERVPDVRSAGPVDAVLTVAGHPACTARLEPRHGVIGAQRLRAAVLAAIGYELCRLVVREGIIGRPFDDGVPLAERLGATGPLAVATPLPLAGGAGPPVPSTVLSEVAGGAGILIARRPGVTGTAASRPAAVPAAALEDVLAGAALDGVPVLRQGPDGTVRPLDGGPHGGPARYVPEILWRPGGGEGGAPADEYEGTPDPWDNESAYERVKYAQTIGMLPGGPLGRALEVACGSGWLSELLAPRVGSLVATDISPAALRWARTRLVGAGNVAFRTLDISRDAIGETYDVIVASEVLYLVPGGWRGMRRALGRLADGLEPGGHLVMAHAHLFADDPSAPGYTWPGVVGAETVARVAATLPDLRLEEELRVPLYRIQRYRKDVSGRRRPRLRLPRRAPEAPVRHVERQPTGLAPRLTRYVRWGPAMEPDAPGPGVAAERLPILMYHRVAPDGAERMRRWRVTPSELDAQLRALRRRGYQSVDLAEWRDAAFAREALPGRPIVLTFDDGYEDFLEWAWPICARHGFSAVLFVVADHVGGTNAWDSADSGEEVRLLGWPELRALAEDGVVIGSHTASHPRLAEISPSDALREMARSRAEISRRLGVQVDALAYPYGDFDTAVRRLAGAAGYTFAVTCEVRRAEFGDSLLTLPRIEVEGGMGPARFLAAVEGRTPPPD